MSKHGPQHHTISMWPVRPNPMRTLLCREREKKRRNIHQLTSTSTSTSTCPRPRQPYQFLQQQETFFSLIKTKLRTFVVVWESADLQDSCKEEKQDPVCRCAGPIQNRTQHNRKDPEDPRVCVRIRHSTHYLTTYVECKLQTPVSSLQTLGLIWHDLRLQASQPSATKTLHPQFICFDRHRLPAYIVRIRTLLQIRPGQGRAAEQLGSAPRGLVSVCKASSLPPQQILPSLSLTASPPLSLPCFTQPHSGSR